MEFQVLWYLFQGFWKINNQSPVFAYASSSPSRLDDAYGLKFLSYWVKIGKLITIRNLGKIVCIALFLRFRQRQQYNTTTYTSLHISNCRLLDHTLKNIRIGIKIISRWNQQSESLDVGWIDCNRCCVNPVLILPQWELFWYVS